jgi:hypothetical protein
VGLDVGSADLPSADYSNSNVTHVKVTLQSFFHWRDFAFQPQHLHHAFDDRGRCGPTGRRVHSTKDSPISTSHQVSHTQLLLPFMAPQV